MGGPYIGDASTFLVQTLLGLYALIVMLRFLLQLVRADFYNPVSQFVWQATQPVLAPARRVVPPLGGLDTAAIAVMLGVKFTELWLVTAILGIGASLSSLLMLSVAELLALLFNVFLFSILIEVVLSWINPGTAHPVARLVRSLNAPLLRPARRLLPPMSGIDLSPMAVIIALMLASMLLVAPLRDLARQL
jgi:YggT family protein